MLPGICELINAYEFIVRVCLPTQRLRNTYFSIGMLYIMRGGEMLLLDDS